MKLSSAVIERVTDVLTIHSVEGRVEEMRDRVTYGLSFSYGGQITYTQNGKQFVSDRLHAVLLPQGQNYSTRRDKTGDFPLINFTCVGFLCNTVTVFELSNPEQVLREFEQLRRLFPFEENRARIMSIFYGILHTLCTTDSRREVLPALRYIEQHYQDTDLTNAILARECGISEVYFRRLFLEKMGTSPRQYLIDVRMQKAKQLLAEGALKISAVAQACGFSNPYHFCRVFRRCTGVTPTDYRTQNDINTF